MNAAPEATTAGRLLLAFERSRPRAAAHSRRVAELAERVGNALGLDDARLELLRQGALFHDVGKLGVSKAILAKRSPLSPGERARMEQHAEFGAELARDAGLEHAVVQLVQQHHERLDGSGYPWELGAELLGLEVRILAVCDVYDALTSDRPYAPAWPPEQALAHLRGNTGRLDARCADALQQALGCSTASSILTAA
jgi:putative nucleotidyltransferase with HDIG domain